MNKVIVLGIIALFVGVGFQPAFAIESRVSVDYTQNLEDCDCKEVDRINPLTAELLLNKLKVSSNILLSRFRHIPAVEEKSQELMDVINSYEQSDDRPICDFLLELLDNFECWYYYYYEKAVECDENGQLILREIYFLLCAPYWYLAIFTVTALLLLDCIEFPY